MTRHCYPLTLGGAPGETSALRRVTVQSGMRRVRSRAASAKGRRG